MKFLNSNAGQKKRRLYDIFDNEFIELHCWSSVFDWLYCRLGIVEFKFLIDNVAVIHEINVNCVCCSVVVDLNFVSNVRKIVIILFFKKTK